MIGLLCVLTEVFADAVGQDNFKQGTETVFEILQQPKLNKQVSAISN